MTEKWDAVFAHRIKETENGCLLWTGYCDSIGYGRIGNKKTKQVKTHRASYELAYGEIPAGMVVMHTCDVRNCVNPKHLRLGTQADNVADMVAKGRHKPRAPQYGSDNPISVLDEDTVWEIRCLLKIGEWPQRQLATEYGVSPMTISRIANFQTWKHVDESYV